MSVLKRKGIIFDFDGVILDSVSIKGEAFGALFRSFGQEVVNQIVAYHHANGGLPRYEKFKFIHHHILNIEYTEGDRRRLSCEFETLVLDRLVQANPIPSPVIGPSSSSPREDEAIRHMATSSNECMPQFFAGRNIANGMIQIIKCEKVDASIEQVETLYKELGEIDIVRMVL